MNFSTFLLSVHIGNLVYIEYFIILKILPVSTDIFSIKFMGFLVLI